MFGRPLLYIGHDESAYDCPTPPDPCEVPGATCLQPSDIAAFKQDCGDVYIVLMGWSPEYVADEAVRLNADAISTYAFAPQDPLQPQGTSHANFKDQQEHGAVPITSWDYYKAQASAKSKKYIPNVTGNWDIRPRMDNPDPEVNYPSDSKWAYSGTPVEVATIFQDAINFVKDNYHTIAPNNVTTPNTIISYAWNEFDEGGGICPKLEDYGGAKDLSASATAWGGNAEVSFHNITADGVYVNGWWDNASPYGIDFKTNKWTSWIDGTGYGLTKRVVSTVEETARNISVPSGMLLKGVDIGKCGTHTATVTFSDPSGNNPTRNVTLTTSPNIGYSLNWIKPTPSGVNITVDVPSKTCAWSVVFDNFVYGYPADTTVTFANILNNGDPINGWQDNPSPNGINFNSGNWTGWDGAPYGLNTGKAAGGTPETARRINLPAGKRLKKVDVGRCTDVTVTGTITFAAPGSGNPTRSISIGPNDDLPWLGYNLFWDNPSPNVDITITTNKACAWPIVMDNFVFGD